MVVVENMRGAHDRLAHRPRFGQPVGGEDAGGADTFGSRIEFEQDRSPPVDHRVFHGHRARGGGMYGDAVTAQVVPIPNGGIEFEHPNEHRRHPLTVRDPVPLDEFERGGGIEMFHHNDGPAVPQRTHRPAQRCRVIQRRRAQIHIADTEPEQPGQPFARDIGGTYRMRHRPKPFRSPWAVRWYRRVQQEVALGLVGDRFGRVVGEIQCPPERIVDRIHRVRGHRGFADRTATLRRRHHQRRTGIGDDVTGFGGVRWVLTTT